METAAQLQRLEVLGTTILELQPILQAAVGLKALKISGLGVLDAAVLAPCLQQMMGLQQL